MQQIQKLRHRYNLSMLIADVVTFVIIVCLTLLLFKVQANAFVVAFLIMSLILVIYRIIASHFFFKTIEKKVNDTTRFYMVHTLTRLLLGGVLAYLCTMLVGQKAVVVCFGIFFILTLMVESIWFVSIEKTLNEK